MGPLTGSAFPQGNAIIKWTLSLPEKAEGFTIRPYPQDSGALHMSIFEQPSIVYSVLWEEVILATDGKLAL